MFVLSLFVFGSIVSTRPLGARVGTTLGPCAQQRRISRAVNEPRHHFLSLTWPYVSTLCVQQRSAYSFRSSGRRLAQQLSACCGCFIQHDVASLPFLILEPTASKLLSIDFNLRLVEVDL